MSKCRICLASNVRMHLLSATRFQEIYEKLSGTKLNTEDGMPDSICFICNSQVQKFCKFFEMSERAEKILKEKFLDGVEITQASSCWKPFCNLTTTSVHTTSFLDNGEVIESEVTVSPEVTVTIKEEPVDEEEEDLKEEYLESSSPSNGMLNGATLEATPNALQHPEFPTEPEKFENPMEFCENEVCIKTETIEPGNIEIAQSLLRNLFSFENIPLEPPMGLEYIKKAPKTEYYCNLCHYKSISTRSLKTHSKVHNQSYMFSCEFCLYRFVSTDKLERHRNYCTVCSICGKKFSNINCLRTHVRLHTGIQPFYCDTCGRGFNQKTNLQTHMRVHTRDEQHPCSICNKKFPFKSFLERHMLIHENNLDIESFNRTINCHKLFKKKKNRPCACKICGRLLQSASGLGMHMRLHTGERPFSCEICDRVFTQKANLLTHVERVHTGDKKLCCKVCHKIFPFNREMQMHMLSHEKSYSARDFEIFQQKHIYVVHRGLQNGQNGQNTPYICDMCQTRVLSY